MIPPPENSEVLNRFNTTDKVGNKFARRHKVFMFAAVPSEISVNDLNMVSECRRAHFKIEFGTDISLYLELEVVSGDEINRYRIKIALQSVNLFDVVSETNVLNIHANSYTVSKMSREGTQLQDGSSLFNWTDTSIIEILEHDLPANDLRLSIQLEPDVSGRTLSERYDILNRLSAQTNLLTIDQVVYARSSSNSNDSRFESAVIYGQVKKEHPAERHPVHAPQHETIIVSTEEKPFEENFSRQDLTDFKNFEANEMSRFQNDFREES